MAYKNARPSAPSVCAASRPSRQTLTREWGPQDAVYMQLSSCPPFSSPAEVEPSLPPLRSSSSSSALSAHRPTSVVSQSLNIVYVHRSPAKCVAIVVPAAPPTFSPIRFLRAPDIPVWTPHETATERPALRTLKPRVDCTWPPKQKIGQVQRACGLLEEHGGGIADH
jgi:hypothetical protein